MSCTENERGSLVVFLIPAVIGCLSLLLVRRWSNTQVSGTVSTTAVSRRRKIIKDPPVKRPLPPAPVKMVAPSSKKSASVSKKNTVNASDEDANGGGKRVGRSLRPSPPTANGSSNITEKPDLPPLPKHIPFPYIPQDGELLFESMTFIFGIVAMGLQFLNLYRTTWWLPNSNTTQAIKFYLIDAHLVAFIVTILFRRLLLSLNVTLLRYLLQPKTAQSQGFIAARMFILGVVLGALAWCAYFIAQKHSLMKLFYLCYPVIVYFILFGFRSAPFLELSNSPNPLLHSCTHNAEHIQAEVDFFREDFNMRLKKIIFNSLVDAYYTSFIPCCFAQTYIFYDVFASTQQIAAVCAGSGARYATHLLSASYCDVVHRAAVHLGSWKVHTGRVDENVVVSEWSSGTYRRGALVSSGGRVYVAAGSGAAATPGDKRHASFYKVFIDPSNLQCMFLCMQLALIIVQVMLLFSSLQWHHFLALVILLFINYYTLFKMLRDYLVSWKVYKAELLIHDRNGTMSGTN